MEVKTREFFPNHIRKVQGDYYPEKPDFSEGDEVMLNPDYGESPTSNIIGGRWYRVLAVEENKGCQSGWLVNIDHPKGRGFCSNWFFLWRRGESDA